MSSVNLWLDDIRPAPVGWVHAKTVEEAKKILTEFHVVEASLDHDLGACSDCLDGMSPEEWLQKTAYSSMPHCEHFGTGYTLVCWMEETGIWPEKKPRVHSANPSGRERMQLAIETSFRRD